jgi:hypothetical protein
MFLVMSSPCCLFCQSYRLVIAYHYFCLQICDMLMSFRYCFADVYCLGKCMCVCSSSLSFCTHYHLLLGYFANHFLYRMLLFFLLVSLTLPLSTFVVKSRRVVGERWWWLLLLPSLLVSHPSYFHFSHYVFEDCR